MKTSPLGVVEILLHEGMVLSSYEDVSGIKTIGVGHTKSCGPPDPHECKEALTVGEAMEVFRGDLSKFERRVDEWVTVPLAQHEFDALVSFDFNTGGIRYRKYDGTMACASLVDTLNEGDRPKAAAQFMNWCKPRILEPRRRREMVLFSTGRYSVDPQVRVYEKFPGPYSTASAEELNS